MIKRFTLKGNRMELDIIGQFSLSKDTEQIKEIMFKAIMHLSFSEPSRATELFAEYQAIGVEK